MGRKPSTPGAIPRLRVRPYKRARGRAAYYYDHGVDRHGRRHLEPLGNDRIKALQRWAELEGLRDAPQARPTVRALIGGYRARELPHKAPKTVREYDVLLGRIQDVWGDLALEQIQARQVAEWYDLTRQRRGLATANRTRAVFSALINWARRVGYTNAPSPIPVLKGTRERGRDRLVTDSELAAILKVADPVLGRAIRLAAATGLRPGDLLRLERSNIVDGALVVQTSKTRRPVAIVIEGDLEQLVAECLAHVGTQVAIGPRLLRDERGYALGAYALRSRFDRARRLAGADWQFRDLRARAVTRAVLREGLEAGQRLAGHSTPGMTARYSRGVKPSRPS